MHVAYILFLIIYIIVHTEEITRNDSYIRIPIVHAITSSSSRNLLYRIARICSNLKGFQDTLVIMNG